MKKYYIVRILKDALTGVPVSPAFLLTSSLDGIFGEVVFTGSKAAAKRFITARS